jgi:hypothetical protein
MPSSKRKHAGIERELVRALTWACETAKSEIAGFEWLTHRVDYERLADSLVVTWVFDSDASMNAALASQDKQRMQALSQAAFDDVGISVSTTAVHVEFDSEERCNAQHGGDWVARLNSRQRAGGRHGKGH